MIVVTCFVSRRKRLRENEESEEERARLATLQCQTGKTSTIVIVVFGLLLAVVAQNGSPTTAAMKQSGWTGIWPTAHVE